MSKPPQELSSQDLPSQDPPGSAAEGIVTAGAHRLDDGMDDGPGPRTLGQSLDARTTVLLVSGFASVLLAAVVVLVPVPYAVLSPGPVRDTLGSSNDQPLIEVEGTETYPTSGQLDLTTVSVFGGPGNDVYLTRVLRGWLDDSVAVRPVEEVFPPDQTEEQIDERNSVQMVTSQENATAAALAELNIPVPTRLEVVDFSEGAPAAQVLEVGDIVLAVDGDEVDTLESLRDRLQEVTPGDDTTITLERDGDREEIVVTTTEADGRTLLGVLIDPDFDFPFDVEIQIDNIGGPSAGTMFALGLIDKLTPGELTGGEHVAGTGTIDGEGVVGPIGGLPQKLVGARRAGAEWFLAPEGNCAQVPGNVPDGLQVVKVATLAEAKDAVEAIGEGEGADLPGCSP